MEARSNPIKCAICFCVRPKETRSIWLGGVLTSFLFLCPCFIIQQYEEKWNSNNRATFVSSFWECGKNDTNGIQVPFDIADLIFECAFDVGWCSTLTWFASPKINSRFPEIFLIFPNHPLFQHLKTLPEYPVKSRNPHSLFHVIRPTNGSFFSSRSRVDAWKLKLFTTQI